MLDPKVSGCKGKLVCMVSLIFLSGVAAGGIGMHLGDRYWLRQQSAAFTEAEKQMALQHFSQELDLDSEQARAVENILDEFIMEQADLMQQFRTNRIAGHDRLFRVLNPDQQKRLQKVLDELSNKRKD